MTLTRTGIAEEIDRADDELAALQKDKSEIFRAYREQLTADGARKPDIAAEVTALKAAIRRRRAFAADADAVNARDALEHEILAEISRPAKTGTAYATRARASRASDPNSVTPRERGPAIGAGADHPAAENRAPMQSPNPEAPRAPQPLVPDNSSGPTSPACAR